MVSEDSPSNSNTSILHQFIFSNSIANQNQFANQHFDPYRTDSVSNSPYPHSLPLSIQLLGDRMSRPLDIVHAPQLSDESDMSNDRRLMDLLGTSNEAAHPTQRLSLSLGSVPCRQRSLNSSLLNPGYLISGAAARESCNNVINDYSFSGTAFASMNQSCSTLYGTESFAAAIGSSKYLKPVQSLLEEMVSIGGKDVDATNQKYVEKLSRKGSYRISSDLKTEFSNTELLNEKHGTYVNLLKFLALLEEVERRYEEYYNHMEELVSSFELIAGLGSGKSYTALALQAMSKHFCSLRNAIVSQIRVTKQKIEKDAPKISSRLSQLSLFDPEARQTRISLQQLGLVHNSRQAWRPIRGLPETSVTILRAWLFEHFLHPYPNDSEKLMLASQTGLSKNQVSNWFINARVRLWKPMIEEMYKEEFAESSTESDQLLTSSSTREGVGDSAEDLN
ncbi:Transcription factor MEIS1 [Handroanthus impetiginosus]|uniref:Transcription factor MEIS1 n=1 Tax=Handroanthus impetiginosus TaxID=429701 RepID=A0A2G9HZS4_9LAMI|nr:Transcription factor MEIS1 [Handroanthus impetiginosus]